LFKTSKQLGLILLISFIFINLSVVVNAENGDTDLQPCVNQKITSSPEYAQLTTFDTQKILCLQMAQIEYQSFYDSCDSKESVTAKSCDEDYSAAMLTDCLANFSQGTAEYIACEKQNETLRQKCIDDAFNDCRAQADREREIKDEACAASYNALFEELTTKYTTECQTEADQAKKDKEAADKKEANCGNKKVDEDEECDDGNKTDGDGCNSKCQKEETVPPSIPQIETLPGPVADDVSQVSPYLTSNFLPRVARTIISFAIASAVIGLVLSSIGLLTAYGNEEKYGNAKKGLYFSLIGLVISLLSFAIVQLIFFTGFQIGQVK